MGRVPHRNYPGLVVAFLPASLTRSTRGQSGCQVHQLLSLGHRPGASVRKIAGAQPAGDTLQEPKFGSWTPPPPQLFTLAPPSPQGSLLNLFFNILWAMMPPETSPSTCCTCPFTKPNISPRSSITFWTHQLTSGFQGPSEFGVGSHHH